MANRTAYMEKDRSHLPSAAGRRVLFDSYANQDVAHCRKNSATPSSPSMTPFNAHALKNGGRSELPSILSSVGDSVYSNMRNNRQPRHGGRNVFQKMPTFNSNAYTGNTHHISQISGPSQLPSIGMNSNSHPQYSNSAWGSSFSSASSHTVHSNNSPSSTFSKQNFTSPEALNLCSLNPYLQNPPSPVHTPTPLQGFPSLWNSLPNRPELNSTDHLVPSLPDKFPSQRDETLDSVDLSTPNSHIVARRLRRLHNQKLRKQSEAEGSPVVSSVLGSLDDVHLASPTVAPIIPSGLKLLDFSGAKEVTRSPKPSTIESLDSISSPDFILRDAGSYASDDDDDDSAALEACSRLHHVPEETNISDEYSQNTSIDVGIAEDPNTVFRPTMEDAYIIRTRFRSYKRRRSSIATKTSNAAESEVFAAVYDGHGGNLVSNILKRQLHRHFANQLDLLDEDVERAFHQAYSIVNQSLMHSKHFAQCGSTAICTYVRTFRDPVSAKLRRKLYISNVGDSQCIIGLGPKSAHAYNDVLGNISDEFTESSVMPTMRPPLNMIHSPSASPFVTPTRTSKRFHFSPVESPGNSARNTPVPLSAYRPVSYAHSGHDASECTRIRASGGHVLMDRVNGCLAVTRAFGDHNLQNAGVNANPFQYSLELTDEWVVVLACDGVWDVLSGDEVIECCRAEQSAQDMAKHVCDAAILRGTTDNVTAIVIKLPPPTSLAST